MSIGFWQIAIVVILVVLLFGRGKISDLMGDVAKGIKSSLWYKQTPNRCARLIKLIKDEQVKEWL